MANLEARGLKPDHLEAIQGTFKLSLEPVKEPLRGMSEISGLSLEQHIILDASLRVAEFVQPGPRAEALRDQCQAHFLESCRESWTRGLR